MALHAVIYRYVDDAAALDEHRPATATTCAS